MHLENLYQFDFHNVCKAFIKKYQNENLNLTMTTIAHVSTIDQDKFQIVRRMENPLTKHPLYERIIIDRSEMKLQGFTFENINDYQYQETYSYQRDPVNAEKTIYNAYLFKSPGYFKFLGYKTHQWGVSLMNGIIEQDLKEQMKEILKEKSEAIIEKVSI